MPTRQAIASTEAASQVQQSFWSGTITPSINYDEVKFVWQAVSGASQYNLYVFDDTTDSVAYDNTSVANTTYTLSGGQALTPGHVFSWSAGVGSGNSIIWSPAQTFTLGTLSTPTPQSPSGPIPASSGYDLPTFTFTTVTGAAHYALYLIDDSVSPNADVIIDDSSIGGSTVSVADSSDAAPDRSRKQPRLYRRYT